MDNEKLNAAEAVMGFAAWLTSQPQQIIMSSHDDASPSCEAVHQFLVENGFSMSDIRDNYHKILKHPSEKIKYAEDIHKTIEQEIFTDTRIHFDAWARIKILFGCKPEVKVKLIIPVKANNTIVNYNAVSKVGWVSGTKYVFEKDLPDFGYQSGPFKSEKQGYQSGPFKSEKQ